MGTLTTISRKRVKFTAKKQLAGHFLDAIKANLIVILYTVFQTFLLLLQVYLLVLAYLQDGQILYFNQQSSLFSTVITSTIAMIFTWSAKWTIIDYFQNPKAKINWRQSIQAFQLGHFFATAMLALVQNILIFLWSLLVIPAFVKPFSYSQTYYAYKMDLLFDRQQKSLTDYISISRRVMDGRKMELFNLELSFIGWHVLGIATLGLGYIFIVPYLNTCRVVYSSQVFAQALQGGVS